MREVAVATPRERPILFQGAMVRALLAGTKTQTRRAIAPQPDVGEGFGGSVRLRFKTRRGDLLLDEALDSPEPHTYLGLCPYGRSGDRLWVRENGWERPERTPKMMREGADTWEPYYFDADGITDLEAEDFKAWGFKRRPSIHMPRRACRILLEITEVRVQRLQEINADEAMAEGIVRLPDGGYASGADGRHYHASSAWYSYAALWESINGAGSWEANPWVWAVSFRRIES